MEEIVDKRRYNVMKYPEINWVVEIRFVVNNGPFYQLSS